MIVLNWMPFALVGGFVALAAIACFIEWRWLVAEGPAGRGLGVRGLGVRGLGVRGLETRGPEPRGL
ncbi:hypothetical protein PQJ75_23595 [Rhodoplanes sp. TEM]|uniref:Uncharacterized protein n=1 Tax=Rhodoplanes tepidamans TaxID=200616 RepID=A0ABT5JIK5_RHOTP|nr:MULTISPECIES: hypothetical protein [Rhodoplanes]MDC7789549.1 hypothetical protein [Rhodoplanes tepidamans]MDC7986724.1 hypothetical protein [Rhodoplanes sp. TEM]MDQ0359162.1 hypothetical protein [Rhodoplanes tepidamans]